jgi:Ca2+-binding EF-hand superfamily protein
MFDAIDADGDGQITSPELKKAAAALRKLDADNDGILTRDETRPRGGPGGDPQQFLDRMFTDNDADGDGALTADEVPERMAPMLQGADEDGDGRVTKKEMSTAMENFRNRFRGGPGGGQGGPGGFSGGPGGDPSQMAGGMIGRYDRDGDGKLSPQEVPQQMMGMLRGGDMNQDGLIDAREMAAIAEQAGGRFRGGYGQGGPDGGGRSRQFPGRGDNGRPGGGEQPQQ